MKHLFDSSAIYHIVLHESIEKLTGNYTLELARFELGNIIWKEEKIDKKITKTEQEDLMDFVAGTLRTMLFQKIEGYEMGILKLASELNITFYDAAYVYFSKAMNVPLVTLDRKLMGKAGRYAVLVDVRDPIL